MGRRTFVKHAAAWATAGAVNSIVPSSLMAEEAIHKQPEHAPMELGLLIKPSPDPEAKIRLVHELGFKTFFLSLDWLPKSLHASADQAVRGSAGQVSGNCHYG